MSTDNVYAVIMAGGSGTRFWPLSRAARPKQLLPIVSDATMIQATVARLQPYIPADRVLVITTAALADATRAQLPMLPPEHVIAEPVGRDTAACVCLAALVVDKMTPDATMILLPADQVIEPAVDFQAALKVGVAAASDGSLVTYGIAPRFAATGYGYIQVGETLSEAEGGSVAAVSRFVEKPDQATADSYLADGNYRWNAGIFTWKVSTVIRELETHCSWLTDALAPVGAAWGSPSFDAELATAYEPLKKISVDYALLENSSNIKVVTGTFNWDDVGSWDALYDNLPKNDADIVVKGDVLTIDSEDCLLMSETKQLIAGVGLKGMTVVVTDDAVLVVPKGGSQSVKQVVDTLKTERTDLV